MNISKFPLLSEKLLTYSALNGVRGLALVEELPVSLVQEALSATHNIAENKHFESHAWMKRALFLNGLLNDLPLAEYYVSLGSRNVHIDNLPGYLHNTFGRKMRAVQAPQRRGRPIVYAAQDATVLLLWFVKHDMLLKFFNSIKTMFATRTPDDTITMQAVQNVLMLAWDATVSTTRYRCLTVLNIPLFYQNSLASYISTVNGWSLMKHFDKCSMQFSYTMTYHLIV